MVPSPTFYQSTFKQYVQFLPSELEQVRVDLDELERISELLIRWMRENEGNYGHGHHIWLAASEQLERAYNDIDSVWCHSTCVCIVSYCLSCGIKSKR